MAAVHGSCSVVDSLECSHVGFSGNCFRCCESIEEGRKALAAFLAKRDFSATPTLVAQVPLRSASHENNPTSIAPADDSWWCCFAGGEPGVYQGV